MEEEELLPPLPDEAREEQQRADDEGAPPPTDVELLAQKYCAHRVTDPLTALLIGRSYRNMITPGSASSSFGWQYSFDAGLIKGAPRQLRKVTLGQASIKCFGVKVRTACVHRPSGSGGGLKNVQVFRATEHLEEIASARALLDDLQAALSHAVHARKANGDACSRQGRVHVHEVRRHAAVGASQAEQSLGPEGQVHAQHVSVLVLPRVARPGRADAWRPHCT